MRRIRVLVTWGVTPSIHTTLGADLGSTIDVCCPAAAGRISILDTLARLMGPVVIGQLLQHDDAQDAALTYGLGR
jgi:hypothetical protein